jgi:hypothetical protein
MGDDKIEVEVLDAEGEPIDIKAAAKAFAKLGASKGGIARANALSEEQRRDIARRASEARWAKTRADNQIEGIPRATHAGVLKIGGIEIPCYVLEDGRRLLSQRGMVKALGMSSGSTANGADRLVAFATQKSLEPFISRENTAPMEPFRFVPPHGGNPALGYNATILADICDAVLEARKAGLLLKRQIHIADRCEILMRGFARVGIIALVDEATGYQEDREKNELRRILEAYISGELLAWAERFPREFYRELFRLWGWHFDSMSAKRPRMVGKLTKALIYKKLPPGVLEELEKKNPPVYEGGYRKHQHHRYLTPDIGNIHLEKHVASVTTLMKISPTWEVFMAHFEQAFPPAEKQLSLLSPEDSDQDER